jgi:hypothetical protein
MRIPQSSIVKPDDHDRTSDKMGPRDGCSEFERHCVAAMVSQNLLTLVHCLWARRFPLHVLAWVASV